MEPEFRFDEEKVVSSEPTCKDSNDELKSFESLIWPKMLKISSFFGLSIASYKQEMRKDHFCRETINENKHCIGKKMDIQFLLY